MMRRSTATFSAATALLLVFASTHNVQAHGHTLDPEGDSTVQNTVLQYQERNIKTVEGMEDDYLHAEGQYHERDSNKDNQEPEMAYKLDIEYPIEDDYLNPNAKMFGNSYPADTTVNDEEHTATSRGFNLKDLLQIFPISSGCSCGKAKSNRILGGKEVDIPQKYPWAVVVKLIKNYVPVKSCAGSIIGERWVLTSAHCVVVARCPKNGDCKYPSGKCSSNRKTKKAFTQVTIGDAILKNIKVVEEYIHPNFTDCNAKHYDFALLELEESISFNEHLMPVCLPANSLNTFGCQAATVIGWGRHDADVFTHSTKLREHRTKIQEKPWCGLWNKNGDMDQSQICAGGEVAGEGICHGDNGGPLMVEDDEGRYTLVGVASYVYENCGHKYWPDVYGRVTEVLPWIHQHANETCSQL
ncbi:unnamed protein product, partial [Meganyctiphanes norvegica]